MSILVFSIQIASMTKSPFPLWDIILLGPYLAFLNVYVGRFLPEQYVLIILAVRKEDTVIDTCSLL